MFVDAIIVAAGASTRFGGKTKKQFYLLAGKPILVHCLSVIQRSKLINRIILVVPAEQQEVVRKSIVQKYRFNKVVEIIPGGKQRQNSVWNGLQALAKFGNSNYVLIHDGVRPFITETMIRDTICALKKTGAASIATKITDTVKIADKKLFVEQTIPREKLWCVQTPQGFKFSLLLDAYGYARKKNIEVTDDAGIIEQFGIPVTIVPGSVTNIKITTKQDIQFAETILKIQEPEARI